MNPGKVHQAYAVTGAIALGAAALSDDAIVQRVLSRPYRGGSLTIAHPSGVMSVEVRAEAVDGKIRVRSAVVQRTARRILDGCVYVPSELIAKTGKTRTAELSH